MAHITLSIPDELYKEMKKHPEIKWSEAARNGITRQFGNIGSAMSGQELLRSLPNEVRDSLERISKLPVEDWRGYYKKMKEGGKRRLKLLTQTSS